ncbi:hypothetical protein SAMN05216474_3144 [Lishizhenia tianjinensis]|uniref:Tetratricopeptide repeat-containing protein n=1 Tax=Lishizhenia tianjinensis TaxID=477690 RepID=A0A1I7BWI9_9FLAO|nr:hypothetical protein [Lishizhenia tianjinensis]SFT91548.1 hypothetical protein SAMN05216474_3144 [Lishizhenia tianjinensis]
MNKAELTERIIDPKKIQQSDIPALKNLAEKYSFSPVFSLLLLSGLSQHDDFSFEEELSEHAYRIPDRIRLFNLTHDIQTQVNIEEPELEIPEPDATSFPIQENLEVENLEVDKELPTENLESEATDSEEFTEEALEEVNEEISEDQSTPSSIDETPIFSITPDQEIEEISSENEEEKAEEDFNHEETLSFEIETTETEITVDEEEQETLNVEKETAEKEDLPTDILEIDMYATAVSRTIEHEVRIVRSVSEEEGHTEQETEVSAANTTSEQVSFTEESTDAPAEDMLHLTEEQEVETNDVTPQQETEKPKDFFAWLAAKKAQNTEEKTQEIEKEALPSSTETEVAKTTLNSAPIAEEEITPETREENQKLGSVKSDIEEKTEVQKQEKEELEAPKSKVDSIIEKFINEEPQISRPKKEFFSPSKVAKKSLDESSLPVSETLAQIFAAQGNYPKAIASYEQLMLKFPEKKSFFANQIKKLKQKLIK